MPLNLRNKKEEAPESRDFVLTGSTLKGPPIKGKAPFNQDNYIFLERGDLVLLAVSDGLGSKKRSHEGSKLVTEFLEEEWKELTALNDDTLEEQALILLNSASSLLQEKDHEKEMSCTLTVLLLNRKGGWATASIGDSFAVTRKEGEDTYNFYSGSDKSRKSKNVTETLSEISSVRECRSGEEKLAFAAVSSDGLDFAGIFKEEPVPAFWSVVEREIKTSKDIDDFLVYLDLLDKIIDDTTLVVYRDSTGEQEIGL